MHNPFAKWKTLRVWEGREGRWTESTDNGPASENDGTCVIMGDRRLSPKTPTRGLFDEAEDSREKFNRGADAD